MTEVEELDGAEDAFSEKEAVVEEEEEEFRNKN